MTWTMWHMRFGRTPTPLTVWNTMLRARLYSWRHPVHRFVPGGVLDRSRIRFHGISRHANNDIKPRCPHVCSHAIRRCFRTTKCAQLLVKQQEQCDSCWSFSATGGFVEHWQQVGAKLSFSEQQPIECFRTNKNVFVRAAAMLLVRRGNQHLFVFQRENKQLLVGRRNKRTLLECQRT